MGDTKTVNVSGMFIVFVLKKIVNIVDTIKVELAPSTPVVEEPLIYGEENPYQDFKLYSKFSL